MSGGRRSGGNPFLLKDFTAADAVACYRDEIASSLPFHELRGKDLTCWCSFDQPCHADVLLDMANK